MRLLAVALLVAGCAGPGADAYDRALAALAAGDAREAARAAAETAASADPEVAALGEFLRGNAAFALCEGTARQAETPGSEPFAFDVAIGYGRQAARFWQSAAMSRDDWPAARRNVERALLKLEELKRKKAAADRERAKQAKPQPRPRPLPRVKPPEEKEAANADDGAIRALSPDEVRRLIARLAEKEKEKRELRAAARKARSAGVERDW